MTRQLVLRATTILAMAILTTSAGGLMASAQESTVPGSVGQRLTQTSTDLMPAIRTPATTARAYVAFGDSFAANPEIPLQMIGLLNRECVQSPQGYPERVGREAFEGDYANYTCNNATLSGTAGRGVIDMIHQAQANGDLGADTRLVTLGAGGADDWNPQLGGLPDFGAVFGGQNVTQAAWTARMTPVLEALRAAAPQARVMFIGYPEIDDGRGGVCVLNISDGPGGSSDTNLPVAVPVRIGELLDTINRHAAGNEQLGYEFVDTDVPGTGTCADPSRQWVRAVVDLPGAGDGLRMPVHPSALGERGMADLIISRL